MAGVSQASRSRKGPVPGSSGTLLSLAAAAATAAARFPFDAVLAGMVAAGQGILAICLYLGLSHKALDDHLVRLGLRTPPDRPLRNPGPKGWSTLQTIYLIVWRVAGIHPETIAQRLSQLGPPRSANAVRAKARRLGIPRPDRKSLRKVDPATLPYPVAGLGAIADTGFPGLPRRWRCRPALAPRRSLPRAPPSTSGD